MLWMRSGGPHAMLSTAGAARGGGTVGTARAARTAKMAGTVRAARAMGTAEAVKAAGAVGTARAARVAGPALLAILCVFALAGSAWAGEYHVYSCRMPNGQVAPTDGWSGNATGVAVYAEDKCAKGGPLIAALGAGVSHSVGTDIATWTFSVPVGEILSKASLWRAGDAEGGAVANATYEFWLAGPIPTEAFDSCVYVSDCMKTLGETEEPLSGSNLLSVPAANLGEHIYVNASCGGLQSYKCPSGKGDSSGYAAVVYLYAADLVLDQTSQPRVSEVEGELATAATLSGTDDLSFHAEDTASGVYRVVFTVDGTEVAATVLSSNNGHCQNVSQTSDGLPAFLYLQPCPASLTADVPFDTTSLTDGSHHLVVSVTNAAGNSTVALDRDVTVQNHTQAVDQPTTPSPEGQQPLSTEQHDQSIQTRPSVTSTAPPPTVGLPNNGTNASAAASLQVRWSATSKASLAGSYGRAQSVEGRLTAPAGVPIGGAAIQVLDTPAYERAPTRDVATVRTAANGSFSFRVPTSTPSSTLTFAYSAQLAAPAPSVTGLLQLRIPASLTLQIAPRSTHRGGTIVFSGRLRGAPLPPGGKQLVLEARTLRGQWRQFQTFSTARGGAYRATYRFRLAGPIDYKFRAVSPQEADFPYARGYSNVVLVHER